MSKRSPPKNEDEDALSNLRSLIENKMIETSRSRASLSTKRSHMHAIDDKPELISSWLKPSNKKTPLKLAASTTEEESSEWSKTMEALERKSKLYDLLQKGDLNVEEISGGNQLRKESILVDFDRKGWDSEAGEYIGVEEPAKITDRHEIKNASELVEYLDEFGRTRMVTLEEKESLIKEREETKYLVELYKKAGGAGPSHYDANWEVRDKGIGFFKFSKDEIERQRQMQSLRDLRKNTKEERQKNLEG